MRLVVLLVFLLVGCKDALLLPTITPHKMNIQQGNVITQDMVDKLQPGMSRSQVRFILGTPLVIDPFRADRWDYVYYYQKGGQAAEQRRLIVLFKDDKLLRVEGDQMPAGPPARSGAADIKTGAPPAPSAAPRAGDKAGADAAPQAGDKAGTAPEPAKDATTIEPAKKDSQGEEKGFFGRLLESLGF